MRSIIPWSRCAPFYSYLRTALSINFSLKGRRMAEAASQILHIAVHRDEHLKASFFGFL